MVLTAELFYYTWCRVQCIHTGYLINMATATHQDLKAQQNQLKIEISHLKSPERIARIAKDKLGLAMPSLDQTIVISYQKGL